MLGIMLPLLPLTGEETRKIQDKFRPITTTTNLNNVWDCVLIEARNVCVEDLLDDAVFGFRPHGQTSEVAFILSRLVAHARAKNEGLFVCKLDVSKAFVTGQI